MLSHNASPQPAVCSVFRIVRAAQGAPTPAQGARLKGHTAVVSFLEAVGAPAEGEPLLSEEASAAGAEKGSKAAASGMAASRVVDADCELAAGAAVRPSAVA